MDKKWEQWKSKTVGTMDGQKREQERKLVKDNVDEDETGMKRSVSGGSLLGDS